MLQCRGLVRTLWKGTYNVNETLQAKTHAIICTLIFIGFAIESIPSGPPFLKSCDTFVNTNVFAGQSPTFPTNKPIKIYTFRISGRRSGERRRKTISESSRQKFTIAFITPSLEAKVYVGVFSEKSKFKIIDHLQRMIHDTWWVLL